MTLSHAPPPPPLEMQSVSFVLFTIGNNRSYLSLIPFQSPPKGATIPYRPKPASTPVMLQGAQVGNSHGFNTMQDPDWV